MQNDIAAIRADLCALQEEILKQDGLILGLARQSADVVNETARLASLYQQERVQLHLYEVWVEAQAPKTVRATDPLAAAREYVYEYVTVTCTIKCRQDSSETNNTLGEVSVLGEGKLHKIKLHTHHSVSAEYVRPPIDQYMAGVLAALNPWGLI